MVLNYAFTTGDSCLPADELELSMDSEDDEPILDLVSPSATAKPTATPISPERQAKRKIIIKFIAVFAATVASVTLLTVIIVLAVHYTS